MVIKIYVQCLLKSHKFYSKYTSTRMRSSRMHIAYCLLYRDLLDRDLPGQRSLLDRDPLDSDPPWRNMGPETETLPLEGTWDQAARQEVTLHRDPHPTDRTRMHSSRMRTGRSLTVFQSLLFRGGVSGRGGVLSRGVLVRGGWWLVREGGGVSGLVRYSPPVNRMNDRQV